MGPLKLPRIIINKFNYGAIRRTMMLDPYEGAVTYLDIINPFNGKLLRRTTFKNGKIVSSVPAPHIDDEIE
jgi:antitoxin component YwqK of YwqJK toxin-antitoxin module